MRPQERRNPGACRVRESTNRLRSTHGYPGQISTGKEMRFGQGNREREGIVCELIVDLIPTTTIAHTILFSHSSLVVCRPTVTTPLKRRMEETPVDTAMRSQHNSYLFSFPFERKESCRLQVMAVEVSLVSVSRALERERKRGKRCPTACRSGVNLFFLL